MHKVRIGSGLPLLLALALLSPIAAFAQTTVSSRVSEFELLAVDGNHLVVRDQNGTRELTVPPDFRFTVNGKAMAASELKAGMKGTAVITTTTTERPVYVTTVKKGTVVNQTGKSVVIKEDNGKVHRFTQSEVDSRGIQLFIGDAPKRLFDLSPGDQISATIVTAGKPEILTSQAVEAELAAAAAAPPPPPAPVAAAPVSEPPAAEPAAEPAPEPQVAATEVEPTPEVVNTAAEPVKEELPRAWTKHPFFYLLLAIIIIALIYVLMRRRVKKDGTK